MRDKVLVTGGAGYIGSVFVPHLLEKGYQVTVLDNFIYNQSSLLDVCYNPCLDIIVGDVRDEKLLKDEVIKQNDNLTELFFLASLHPEEEGKDNA